MKKKPEVVKTNDRKFSVVVDWKDPLVAETYIAATLRFFKADGTRVEKLANVEFLPENAIDGSCTYMDEQKITMVAAAKLISADILIMGGPWKSKSRPILVGVSIRQPSKVDVN